MMVTLAKVRLSLFLSYGGSLQSWSNGGLLEREMAIYQRLLQSIDGLDLFSYGTGDDHEYSHRYKNCRALLWPFPKGRRYHERFGPFLHRRSLASSSLYKTNQIYGAMAAVRAKRLYGKPLIVRCGYLWSVNSEREGDSGDSLQKKRDYERICFKEADICVVSTQRDKGEIINAYDIDAASIRVIPNYVDTDIFKQVTDRRKTPASLVFIGRLSKEKNLYNLLDAIDQVDGIETVTLVGDGPERAGLEKRATTMKTAVNFTGARPSSDIPGIISAHIIFILCSHYEGMPKALIEAMTLGMPCLGTDVRGIRDIIRHNENGLLCPITSDGIALGLRTLTDNPELCHRLGEEAKRYAVEAYGIEAVAALERSVITEVLEKTQ